MRYRSSMRRGQAIMRRPSYEARREGRTGCRCRYGFSMLELLVTVAIILILTTLYWSPNSGSRQRSLQTACQKSLQKVYIALDVYANDWGGRFPNVRGAHTSGEPSICSCPSTPRIQPPLFVPAATIPNPRPAVPLPNTTLVMPITWVGVSVTSRSS